MLKAVIFDLDGLLVDSTPLQLEANRIFIESFGKPYLRPKGSREGMRIIDIIRDYKDIFDLPGDINKLYAKRQQIYFELARSKLELFPGVFPLLKKLHLRNIQIAMATSGDAKYLELVFNKFPKLREYFAQTVNGDQVKRGKPYPDIYLKTLELLKVKANEAVVIEDSVNGILAAKTAHTQVIAVPNHKYPEADYTIADRIFPSLFEVASAISV